MNMKMNGMEGRDYFLTIEKTFNQPSNCYPLTQVNCVRNIQQTNDV